MFEITERAARQIAETCRRRRAPAGGFRIRREGGPDEALKVGFIARPQRGDHVFEEGDAHVYVAPDAMESVEGWVLDSRMVEHRTSLFLRRPRPPGAASPEPAVPPSSSVAPALDGPDFNRPDAPDAGGPATPDA